MPNICHCCKLDNFKFSYRKLNHWVERKILCFITMQKVELVYWNDYTVLLNYIRRVSPEKSFKLIFSANHRKMFFCQNPSRGAGKMFWLTVLTNLSTCWRVLNLKKSILSKVVVCEGIVFIHWHPNFQKIKSNGKSFGEHCQNRAGWNFQKSQNFYKSPSGNDPKSSLPERRAPRNFEQAVSPEKFSWLFFGKNFENWKTNANLFSKMFICLNIEGTTF